ncbi:MAG TPA: hypothetical protein P5567_02055 [Kiritimatiellia bacterium]|nr:hypothetical protein [Kiritimatiellia bacterium]HRZ11218.1 hypothetical protein [Kiritimatiellia bacterium]HSA19069.1 hypothetical protein [Kiritimatiellia bacterium]
MTDATPSGPGPKRLVEAGIALLVVAAALLLATPAWRPPKLFPDSLTYIQWDPIRPPAYCAFVALFGQGAALVQVQSLLSLLSWAFAGWMLGRGAGLFLLTLLAMSLPVAQWNLMLLSESFSYSLVMLAIGLTLRLLRKWSWGGFAAWVAVAALLSFARLSNLFITPFLALPFLARARTAWRAMGAASLALFLAGLWMSATRGADFERMELSNVIMGRILPDPEARAFFHARGMPLDERVMSYSGRLRSRAYRELWARAPEFRAWLTPEGMRTYRAWLLRDGAAFRAAWRALAEGDSGIGNCLGYGGDVAPRPVAARLLPFYLWLGKLPPALWLALMLLLPLLDRWRDGPLSPRSLLLPALATAAYAQAFICFHGDADEVPRHMLIVGLLYRVTILAGLCGAVRLAAGLFAGRKREAAPLPPSGQASAQEFAVQDR